MIEKRSTGKLIRDLILVLSLGAISAVLVALAVLYFLGPTGSYKAENVLLSPEVMSQLSYKDISPLTGKPVSYRFGEVDFLFFDRDTKEWRRKPIDKDVYKKFYALVSPDRSLVVVPEYVISLFLRENPSVLTLVVEKEGIASADEESRSFQEVQILNFGDYYRIQIHDQEEGSNWAYFFHENIFEKSVRLLLSK